MKKENLPDCFKTDLVLRWVKDSWWKVDVPYGVDTKTVGFLIVPINFLTDGPSIPKMPGLYEEFRDRAWPAAVVHDYLYSIDCPINCTREQADDVFHELMDALYPGWIDKIKNDEEWLGVRTGGGLFFRKEK